jgi:rod shape-determining protein MreC
VALSRRNGRSRATLVFLILISITVITLDFRGDGGGIIGKVRDVAADGLAPVRDAADAVLSPVTHAWSGITGYDDLERENARLQARLDDLQGAGVVDEDATNKLKELLALDKLDWAGDIPTVAAEVVGAPVSNFEQTIELNRGTDAGVDVDMPVVTGMGLVGRVVEASGKRSMVRLITDPASSVGVRASRSGELGIASGEGPDRALSVGFIDVTADLRVGDLLVTSGMEGGSSLYPAALPVGTVSKARKVTGELQQQVRLRPLVRDLQNLQYVKVLQVKR